MSVNLTLQERLRQQHQAESETLQNLTKEQLNSLRSELNDIFQHELNTMRSDMRQQLRDASKELRDNRQGLLNKFIIHRLAIPTLSTALILLVIYMSGWVVTLYQGRQIEENGALIRQQNATLANLANRTGGLDIVQETSGLFVVLPKEAKAEAGWKIGNNAALKITR